MKPNHNILLYTASLLACAGITSAALAADEATASEQPERPSYQPFTFGLNIGTTGVGGSFSWRFADHWGTRVGLDGFAYSYSDLVIGDLAYTAKARLLTEPLTLDIYPWEKHSFHISVGMMFNQNKLSGTGYSSGPRGREGTLEMSITQQPVNPYLGIGGNFLYFDHAHHWALGGELGVAYSGAPSVSISPSSGGPVLDAVLNREKNSLQDYANQYKFYPVLKLMVTYSF